MPNYSLVINSQFKPFSYAELAVPVMEMSNYHERLAQEYDNLSNQADVLEAMGKDDRDKNSGAYSKYKSYSDSLRKEADELYQFGLTTESRRRLTDLRRKYNTDIVPIQNAWTKREKESEEQMKAMLQNPSLMFTRDARTTTLDDYINNPTGGYGVINGANITAQMASMAKNLEKQILDGSARKETIDPFTYDYIRKYGLTPDMIRDWRNNPTLSKMFEQVMQANGVTPEDLQGSLNAQSIIDKSTGYAEMGMWNALGEDKAQIIDNYGARLNAQAAKEIDTYRKKKEIDGEYSNPSGGNNNLVNPLPLRSSQQISDANKKIQEYIQKGYMEQDKVTGQWKMTHKGFEEYRRMSANGDKKLALYAATESGDRKAKEKAEKMPDIVPSKFRTFMDELNGGKSFMDARTGWGPGRAGNLFAQYIKDNQEEAYDTYHSTEYDRQIPSTYGGTFTEQMWSAARSNKGKKVFDVVDYDGKNGWKNVGTKDASDLKGYKVTNVRYSRYGNTAILQKDGEEPIRVRIPRGINLGAEQNVQAAIANADDYGNILAKGKRPMISEDGTTLLKDFNGNIMFTNTNLTPQDRAVFTKFQRDALNEMGSYGSQMVVPSETEHEKYTPFGF